MTTFNHAGLSVWQQLMGRPDFLNAFKAVTQMKKLFIKSDPYLRYFARNIYYLAYNDINIMESSVLNTLKPATQTAIFNDETYGFKDPTTLYQWTRAMNAGSSSAIYQQILSYFSVTKGLTDFTDTTMQQIVGDHSLMFQMNTTMTGQIGFAMKYTGHLVPNDQLITD